MKAFNKLCAFVIAALLAVFLGTNLWLMADRGDSGRPYRVEISRLARDIENGRTPELSACTYVTAITEYGEDFYTSDSDYAIREIGGKLYRFDYRTENRKHQSNLLLSVNLALGVMAAVVLGVMLYVRRKILKPFERLTNVPYELSKGNLTVPVKESKNRFFGRFLWGVDLLRENMEEQKSRELDLQRERKMLLLSLSHDIKTPLSAIKLYAKALSKGLYAEKEKQLSIAESIGEKADEIEGYVSQIITASREDFLSLEVNMGEFYLSALVTAIQQYYTEKLALIKTEFTVAGYRDCLLIGDPDRSVEVIQNIIENAVKYGDGKYIGLEFSEEDGCFLVTVRNSGCTLADTELPHIFESFWRGANAAQEKGSGLGLYICRQLMRKMNGEIFAEIQGDFLSVTAVFGKA